MNAVNDNYKPVGSRNLANLISNKLAVSSIALLTAFAAVQTAWATIDNTVTATGDSPSGTDDVTDNVLETVDVVDAAPSITVTKVADDVTDVIVGQTVTYTYTVENTGNVTLSNVFLTESHDGTGPAPVPAGLTLSTDIAPLLDSTDGGGNEIWDTLAPNDIVTWQSTYVVTQADLDANGGGDNDLDNTVTATASSFGNVDDITGNVSEEVDLVDVNASISISKVADDDTDVTLGQLITYTYTVTNDGNVAVDNITLSDAHGGSGPAPTPTSETLLTDNLPLLDSTDAAADNSWDSLGRGDVITFTGTYTVTQSDIDTLQ